MKPIYYNAFEPDADIKLNKAIQDVMRNINADIDNTVILCVGSDRATGDCLGPLVGNYLKLKIPKIAVFGTLEAPVHAMNLEGTLETIYEQYDKPFIIAIDASLGIPEHIGYATISRNPLLPGKGVNKKLPAIGNISITGIVNVAGFPNSILLQSTRLHTVMTLANCIGSAIYRSFQPAPLYAAIASEMVDAVPSSISEMRSATFSDVQNSLPNIAL